MPGNRFPDRVQTGWLVLSTGKSAFFHCLPAEIRVRMWDAPGKYGVAGPVHRVQESANGRFVNERLINEAPLKPALVKGRLGTAAYLVGLKPGEAGDHNLHKYSAHHVQHHVIRTGSPRGHKYLVNFVIAAGNQCYKQS